MIKSNMYFRPPPEPVANPDKDWSEAYAEWYENGRAPEYRMENDSNSPIRCAECDCDKGGEGCNWIGHRPSVPEGLVLISEPAPRQSVHECGEVLDCYVPKDPETGKIYVNATGSTPGECGANLTMIEMPEAVLLRIDVVRAALNIVEEPTQ